MTRYNEIMERVRVTPALRERVLSKAAEAAAQSKARRSPFKPLALAAACLALVLLGSLALPQLRRDASPTQETDGAPLEGGWAAVEYDSAEALSAAAGFSVRPIPSLEDAGETSYLLISGTLAQIRCLREGIEFCYRVSPGSEDNSGDYNEYPDTRSARLSGAVVTLKGDGERCALAIWEEGGFSFSLAAEPGLPYAEMEALVRDAMER